MEDNMKDNLTDGTPVTADGAEAQKSDTAAADTGKFKDVQALLKAYGELEAEFTRRSQRLRELERGNKENAAPDGAPRFPSPKEDELVAAALSNERVRDAVIGDYLKNVSQKREVPLTAGGGGIAAPRTRPANIGDAGKLAREFFNK